MLAFVSMINIIGIFYLPLRSTNISINLQEIKTRKMIILEKSTGEVRNCQGSNCYGSPGQTRDQNIIIYFIFSHYINDISFESRNDADLNVVVYWHYTLEYCRKLPNVRVRQYRCNSRANEIIYGSPVHITNVTMRGFASYIENYIGCYYMNLTGIDIMSVKNVEECMDKCNNSERWIGLLGKTRWEILCSCFQTLDFGTASVEAEHCDCRFGPEGFELLCGGTTGHVSVYSTDSEPMWMDNNITETCVYESNPPCGVCKSGKLGDRCHLIDCKVQEVCGQLINVMWFEDFCGCGCPIGYFMTDNFTCDEANECLMHLCDENITRCINTVGSYKCECSEGFIFTNDKTCDDIDECLEDPCKEWNEVCNNTIGNYTCDCKQGYRRAGNTCDDFEECVEVLCEGLNEVCINTTGSYFCDCTKGFVRFDGICNDTDECLEAPCEESTEVCNNIIGSYTCDCMQGYIRVDNKCDDIDECPDVECEGLNEECNNTIGSYTCDCMRGYIRVDDECDDIDECFYIKCEELTEVCNNIIGSYTCDCRQGYTRVDDICKEISSRMTISDYDTTSTPHDESDGKSDTSSRMTISDYDTTSTPHDESDGKSAKSSNITTSSHGNELDVLSGWIYVIVYIVLN